MIIQIITLIEEKNIDEVFKFKVNMKLEYNEKGNPCKLWYSIDSDKLNWYEELPNDYYKNPYAKYHWENFINDIRDLVYLNDFLDYVTVLDIRDFHVFTKEECSIKSEIRAMRIE